MRLQKGDVRSSVTATTPGGPSRPAWATSKSRSPGAHDRRPAPDRGEFTPAIPPPYPRRAWSPEGLTPWLHRKGVGTGDSAEALQALLGPDAPGLSATTINRLKAAREGEYEAWSERSLAGKRYVHVWANGVYFNIRLDEGRRCIPVLTGAAADGRKGSTAVAGGYRESERIRGGLLPDCQAFGLATESPLVVGDGPSGSREAIGQVRPSARPRRCWVRKTSNALGELPEGGPAEGRGGLARRPRGRGPGVAAVILRLPGGALASRRHHQPSRVGVRHGAAAGREDEGVREPG